MSKPMVSEEGCADAIRKAEAAARAEGAREEREACATLMREVAGQHVAELVHRHGYNVAPFKIGEVLERTILARGKEPTP